MAHQVFMSHAREDADAASIVCEMLEADSIGCWVPSRDAMSKKDKAAASLQAIRDSELVLLVFSASANVSATVLRDIERAIAYERPVLSIHLDDAAPNVSLEYYLNLWQWLDASGGLEGKRDDIIAAVREQLAGDSDSSRWRWLDAPNGVDSKRAEIVAAVRAQLARAADSANSRGAGAAAAAAGRRRPSRRTWGILVGAALVALAIGLGLGLGLTGTDHQGAWTKLDPAGPPDHGPTAPIVYDSTARRVLVITGSQYDPETISAIKTWAYDPVANTWTELKPAGTASAPAIGDPAMNYDPTTRRLIMFGGCDRPATQIQEDEWLQHPTAGTWAYDTSGNTWSELKPEGTVPAARLEGATAYDPATKRLILFGGVGDLIALGDTWAYDPTANTWTELKPAGEAPPPRTTKMVYDSTTKRMIMFGGGDSEGGILDDVWAYDPAANAWTELKPTGTLPPKRLGFGLAYDPSSQRVVMFGGQNIDGSKYFNDTWAYDPAANSWTEVKPSGTLPRACDASIVYDEASRRLLMFAQGGPDVTLNDIWAFAP